MKLFKRNNPAGRQPVPDRDCEKERRLLKEASAYALRKEREREETKWEQRRWELVRCLVLQDRRSVVLGKLQASERTIVRKACSLADAAIQELRALEAQSHGTEESE